MEDTLVEYLCQCRNSNVPISGKLIQEAALDLAKMNGNLDFKASDRWKSNFLKRHHIGNRKISGESGGLDRSTADKFIDENLP
uniref:CSON010394 protein n=1 Tax=Culicoides sonorensis TaxID=179676 RepID=A0A336N9T2_CULSO